MRLKQKDSRGAGFSLVELLLVAALGVGLCGVAFQLLLGEARQGGALAQRLMVRRLQRRTLQLIKGDLADAQRWQLQPDPQPDWPCSMAHRDVLIAILQSMARHRCCTALVWLRLGFGVARC